ncbi:hypothetical protein SKAU_G00162710 [Synaphobranchus kaupii]|uniref:Uncharacterized protein n=1 Tax=Synaphobranchus kaupii TaxID=118154 RepID=A0A9Q1IZ17_SYNKA|nr:hypothetical protein SKAU_G00162710 [Synaphobranchus kaupii]
MAHVSRPTPPTHLQTGSLTGSDRTAIAEALPIRATQRPPRGPRSASATAYGPRPLPTPVCRGNESHRGRSGPIAEGRASLPSRSPLRITAQFWKGLLDLRRRATLPLLPVTADKDVSCSSRLRQVPGCSAQLHRCSAEEFGIRAGALLSELGYSAAEHQRALPGGAGKGTQTAPYVSPETEQNVTQAGRRLQPPIPAAAFLRRRRHRETEARDAPPHPRAVATASSPVKDEAPLRIARSQASILRPAPIPKHTQVCRTPPVLVSHPAEKRRAEPIEGQDVEDTAR